MGLTSGTIDAAGYETRYKGLRMKDGDGVMKEDREEIEERGEKR